MMQRIFAGILIVAIVSGIATALFWPRTTEGTVTSVQYNNFGSWADIRFDDGRTLRLYGQPPRSITNGKYYVITYNGFSHFYTVEEK